MFARFGNGLDDRRTLGDFKVLQFLLEAVEARRCHRNFFHLFGPSPLAVVRLVQSDIKDEDGAEEVRRAVVRP
ncbi:hypothetical protein [Azospirillum agricola]|uniref:hypothetical protein n=1 Tax=Azospirillum agricola TaxID=1720247 RepID=UPI001CBB5C5A|nr:hypothetical protein [Azospirillum agricola]